MRPLDTKPILRNLAEENNLNLGEVELAIRSQFRYVAKTMRDGKFEQIRLPLFGRFFVPDALCKKYRPDLWQLRKMRKAMKKMGKDAYHQQNYDRILGRS